jgi:hypothetical protein
VRRRQARSGEGHEPLCDHVEICHSVDACQITIFFQRTSTVPPKDTREKRWLMICDSGRWARRRSCGGGHRNVIGRFGISHLLNSYICDIFDTVLSISPPDSDPSACAQFRVDFFRMSAPTEPPASKGPGSYSGTLYFGGTINVLLHFFPATETAPSPSRAYQTRRIRLVKYAGETVLYFLSRGRNCALQHAGPGQSLCPQSPSGKIALTPYKQAIFSTPPRSKKPLVQYEIGAR